MAEQKIQIADKPTLDEIKGNTDNILEKVSSTQSGGGIINKGSA